MDEKTTPRLDLLSGFAWLAVGALILLQSWRMDRLGQLDVEPWSAPGLTPGIIGGVLIVLATILIARAWRQRGTALVEDGEEPGEPWAARRRLGLALLLCALFVFGWLSLRLPFWLGAGLFVASATLLFAAPGGGSLARRASFAAMFGLLSGVVIQLLFQEVFLVRLP